MLPNLEPELAPPPSSRTNGLRRPKRAQGSARYELERRLDGKLWLLEGSEALPVEVVRCFPWTQPDKWLSLRDGAGVERAFIGNLWELDNESRAALNGVLSRSAFVLEVTRVLRVEEDFELRSFQVETEQGPRRFQTTLDAWPRELAGGGLVLEDVHGDLYRLTAPHALDAHSRKWLRALID